MPLQLVLHDGEPARVRRIEGGRAEISYVGWSATYDTNVEVSSLQMDAMAVDTAEQLMRQMTHLERDWPRRPQGEPVYHVRVRNARATAISVAEVQDVAYQTGGTTAATAAPALRGTRVLLQIKVVGQCPRGR